jgi:hypothetical protein
MASGRRDYTYGFASQKQSVNVEQLYWIEKFEKELTPGASALMIEYNVPEGYKLVITGGLVSCNMPGKQRFYVHFGVELWGYIDYDTNYQLPYDPSGTYELVYGETARLYCLNDDDVDIIAYAVLHGFLEEVI